MKKILLVLFLCFSFVICANASALSVEYTFSDTQNDYTLTLIDSLNYNFKEVKDDYYVLIGSDTYTREGDVVTIKDLYTNEPIRIRLNSNYTFTFLTVATIYEDVLPEPASESFDWAAFGTKVLETMIALVPILTVLLATLKIILVKNATIPEVLAKAKDLIIKDNKENMDLTTSKMLEMSDMTLKETTQTKSEVQELKSEVKRVLNQNQKFLDVINILVSQNDSFVKNGKASKIIQKVNNNENEKLQIKE